MGDDRTGRIDRARGSKTLDARGDVDGLAEIILAVVQNDRQARPLMKADLQQQILAAALGIEGEHRVADAQGGGHCPVGSRKRRHHRVADRLDDGARLARNNLMEHAEMRLPELEGGSSRRLRYISDRGSPARRRSGIPAAAAARAAPFPPPAVRAYRG